VKKGSHFLQAHALLNLHIIHSSQSPHSQDGGNTRGADTGTNAETLHPAQASASTSGFKIYSPITNSGAGLNSEEDRCNAMVAGYYSSDFTAIQLLQVMNRITKPNVTFLPYFMLCREFGVRAIDGMVKGRIFDLRWTETVTRENTEEPELPRPMSLGALQSMGAGPSGGSGVGLGLSGSEEGDMVPLSERELLMQEPVHREPDPYESAMEIVGPKLVPTTPIMRYAIREVLAEYEEVSDSGSDYASLTDVEEY